MFTCTAPDNTEVQRVYVYAQTLVIDSSASFRYSLLIRARQIIMDYSTPHSVQIDHYGPVFDMYNLTDAIYRGLCSTHSRQPKTSRTTCHFTSIVSRKKLSVRKKYIGFVECDLISDRNCSFSLQL